MNFSDLLYQQGLAFHRHGLLDKAKQAYQQAISVNPKHAPALHTLGVMASQTGDHSKGLDLMMQALAIDPDNHVYLTNAGTALICTKSFEQALRLSEKALLHKPDHIAALRNHGVALIGLLRFREAVDSFEKALLIKPDFGEVLILRNSALCNLKDFERALTVANRLLDLSPKIFEAHFCKAETFFHLKKYDQACEECDGALDIKPDNAATWYLRGRALEKIKRYTDAVQSYFQAHELNPQLPYVAGALLHAQMLCCDWAGLYELYHRVKMQVDQFKASTLPFGYQAICDDEASLKACAITATQENYPAQPSPFTHPAWPPHQKIRVGYLCGEFREQATSILLTEVWELHDRTRFSLYAFDNGWDDKSPRRARIEQAFDTIIDISQTSDREAARLIHDCEIDILINLNGFFGRERNNVFALRPSPVQVNYLGFPGTMGASYMDYIIADEKVIPPDSQEHYSEKVVYVPSCYQPNDTKRLLSTRRFTRAELDLPESGFVYCCFNNNYKITPATFDVWMSILKQVPESVLWLLQDAPEVAVNLRREAERRGVNEKRLIFAARMSHEEHLARQTMADLFLDTWPYNAHTTASDALWAGLPLLTLQGTTFPGRVAASLLNGMEIPELITYDVSSYEGMAVKLANNPSLLCSLKKRMALNKENLSPFNSRQYAEELMDIYSHFLEKPVRYDL